MEFRPILPDDLNEWSRWATARGVDAGSVAKAVEGRAIARIADRKGGILYVHAAPLAANGDMDVDILFNPDATARRVAGAIALTADVLRKAGAKRVVFDSVAQELISFLLRHYNVKLGPSTKVTVSL